MKSNPVLNKMKIKEEAVVYSANIDSGNDWSFGKVR